MFLAAAALLGALLLAPARAQKPEPKPEEKIEPKAEPGYRLTVRADLVNVEVTVTDARGNFVTGLAHENFRVLDDGAEQPITHFAPAEAPALVLVLVETSPAVYLIHRQHLEAAYALLEGLAADDWVALGTYDQSPRLLINFTQDKSALAQALGSLHYNLGMGQLNLYESLAAALDWLAPLPGKKAIVLLSTGLDTSGAGRWEKLLEKLRASDVVVLPVALGGELRQPGPPGKKDQHDKNKKKKGESVELAKKGQAVEPAKDDTELSFAQADRALEGLAQATGGRAWFPREAREFPGIYRQISGILRHQYSLGFAPPARDARFHKIEIQLLDASGRPLAPAEPPKAPGRPPAEGAAGYRIHARPGYLAPAQ